MTDDFLKGYEPWRIAVIGPIRFPDANRRVYARLKMLKADWPKTSFHIITATTGQVAAAALRAARKLGMEYAAQAAPLERAERVIAYWDFSCATTEENLRCALVAETPTEVWDALNHPAGPAAVDAIQRFS